MILTAILLGLYAIGATGYYKLSRNMVVEGAPDVAEAYPKLYKFILGALAAVWPVSMYWSLVKEAAK